MRKNLFLGTIFEKKVPQRKSDSIYDTAIENIVGIPSILSTPLISRPDVVDDGTVWIEDGGSNHIARFEGDTWVLKGGTAGGGGGGGSILGGIASFNGTGTQLSFQITHGVGQIPTTFSASSASSDAQGIAGVTADLLHIIVTYNIAPPIGVNNVKISWTAN